MNLQPYPLCCGATILADLGGSDSSRLYREVIQNVLAAKAGMRGVVSAITATALQPSAEDVLTELGFHLDRVFTNPNNANAKLKLWSLDVNTVNREVWQALLLTPFGLGSYKDMCFEGSGHGSSDYEIVDDSLLI